MSSRALPQRETTAVPAEELGRSGFRMRRRRARKNHNVEINVVTKKHGDPMGAGIIDPIKVVCFALRNAASVASILLMVGAPVAESPDGPPAIHGR